MRDNVLVVLEQEVERLGRQLLPRLLILDAVLLEEVLCEERDVLPALAKGLPGS